MKLVEKVKALFTDVQLEVKDTFVKTVDGKIISIKGSDLMVDATVMLLDEAGVESVLEDGSYQLDSNKTIEVKDGKVLEISDSVEESIEEETEMEKKETKMEATSLVEGEYVTSNGTKILIDAEGKVAVEEVEVPAETVVEEAKEEKVEMTVVNPNEALEAKIVELETALNAKNEEVERANEAFNKLKSAPATTPIDTRKVEKVETKLNKTSKSPLLAKVMDITNSNK